MITIVRKSMSFTDKVIGYNSGVLYDLTMKEVMNVISDMLVDTLNLTKIDMLRNIQTIPKDTGVMRSVVQRNMLKSEKRGNYVYFYFGASELFYTKEVEKMNTFGTPHVRHPPYVRNRKGKIAKQTLYDPLAIGHPFENMAKFVKNRASLNWDKAKATRGVV